MPRQCVLFFTLSHLGRLPRAASAAPVAMAKEVGASDDPKDFDEAFKKVTSKPSKERQDRS